jgi:hypothetical protein
VNVAARPTELFYQASPLKRVRSTKAEVGARRAELFRIAARSRPATVRQIFYLASVAGLVPKTENGYDMVQSDLTQMRRVRALPYDWLADSTRWQRKPDTFRSVQAALEETARLYRKALWADANAYVEVWLEKDALAGVVYPVTSEFDVPLMVARGYASLSFLHLAAEHIGRLSVPAHIYHLGDFDPSGQDAARSIEQNLREMAPKAEIHFERLAVTPEQIRDWRLPTRPTKQSDSRSRGFGDISVELDAIPPGDLRGLVQRAIEQHLPPDKYAVLKVAEESEQRLIKCLVGMAKANLPAPHWATPYFADVDRLTEAEKADWVSFAVMMRERGNSEEHVIEFCAHLIDSCGCRNPADYLGAEQWRELAHRGPGSEARA